MERRRTRKATPITDYTVEKIVDEAKRRTAWDMLKVRKRPDGKIGRPIPNEHRQFDILDRRTLAQITKLGLTQAMGEMNLTREQRHRVWDAQRIFVRKRKRPNADIDFMRALEEILGRKEQAELIKKFDKLMKQPRKTRAKLLLEDWGA